MKIKIRALACMMSAALLSASLYGCSTEKADHKKANQEEITRHQDAGEAEHTPEDEDLLWMEELEETENSFCYSVDSEVAGLNPVTNASEADNQAYNMICEPLVRNVCGPGDTSRMIPAAAKSWNVSMDGKTYTFHLRKNAKWNDGVRLTAKDFEYTFRLMADPEAAAVNAWLFDGIIKNFSAALHGNGRHTAKDIKVTAKNNRTLVIRLERPTPFFLELAANVYPVRQDKYEEWGEAYGSAVDKIICSGPFEAASWVQDKELVVTKNESYWDADTIKLDKIVQKVIPDPEDAVRLFINGRLDVVSASDPELTAQIKKAGISQVRIVPDGAPEFLMFNLNHELLSNIKIRQALSASSPRQALADALPGGGRPLYSIIPDTMMIGENSYAGLVKGKNDFVNDLMENEKELKALFEDGLKDLGKPADTSAVTIRFASRGTDEVSEKLAGIYKDTWEKALGIHVEISRMEWDEMWEKVDTGDYDIAAAGWSPYYNEPGAILKLFNPESGYFNASKTGWNNNASRKFKRLCDKALTTSNDKELASIYLKMERLLVQGAVIAPVYLEHNLTFLSHTVKNYLVSGNGFPDWTVVEKNDQ